MPSSPCPGLQILAPFSFFQWPERLSTLLVLKLQSQGSWVAQSVERPTSAQVVISPAVSSSPVSGSVLTAQSLEPVSDSVSPSLWPSPVHALSLSVSKINKRWGHLGGAVGWASDFSQVTISRFVSSIPVSGSVLTAQSLEPASDSVSPSLWPSPAHTVSLSKINKH